MAALGVRDLVRHHAGQLVERARRQDHARVEVDVSRRPGEGVERRVHHHPEAVHEGLRLDLAYQRLSDLVHDREHDRVVDQGEVLAHRSIELRAHGPLLGGRHLDQTLERRDVAVVVVGAAEGGCDPDDQREASSGCQRSTGLRAAASRRGAAGACGGAPSVRCSGSRCASSAIASSAVGEAVERLAALGLGRLDHERSVHDQREVDRRRVEAVVDQPLGDVERRDARTRGVRRSESTNSCMHGARS